ncbi:hypothetical protein NDU88_002271 [Pleurodeles waltl]|uniref:Uncharacterized protein n=1 Tax=Pleurodeles waltl TaxID=8319 RepID=A0AAV7M3G4_PLEWA|nr:hypothetical protein NDU88_002271 [Pleurodeles waltl]
MGTPSDASETDFRIRQRKATTDFTEGVCRTEPRKTEEKRPPDAEREFPGPDKKPETREETSTGSRDATVYKSRHNPGGPWPWRVLLRKENPHKSNRGTGEGNRGKKGRVGGGPGEREHR